MLRLLLIISLFYYSCQGRQMTENQDHNSSKTDTINLQKEVVVFVYHRFGNSKYPSTNISLENFDKHLSYLKTNGFKVLTFGEAVNYINNPEITYNKKVACITVDDGYKTFIQNGLPLLKKYGFAATVFINSESVGGGTYMNWEELKQIHSQGIEIGNHSHSHAYFLNTPEPERNTHFKTDIKKCQEAIYNHLGFYPDVFAYPYGEFDLIMKSELKELGFKAAAAQNSGVMHAFDNYAIPRFPMAGPYVKLEAFVEKANMNALRIKNKTPQSFLLTGENPPTLTVTFNTDSADLSRANCFITNGCVSNMTNETFVIKSEKPLEARRTLYTITAPSKYGKGWYWFSYLWIRPEIPE